MENDDRPASTPAALPTPPPPAPDMDALVKKAAFLNVQYGVLFAASMLLLVYNWSGRTPLTTVLWAACLGGAVITRVYRTSLVNKINGKRGPQI